MKIAISDRVEPLKVPASEASLPEVFASVQVPGAGASSWRRMLAFTGPGLLVAVGYMDPGNWATDLAGRCPVRLHTAQSVVLDFQFHGHSACSISRIKLGVVTGQRSCPGLSRRDYPRAGEHVVSLASCARLAIVGLRSGGSRWAPPSALQPALRASRFSGGLLHHDLCGRVRRAFMLQQQRGFRYIEALVRRLHSPPSGLCFAVRANFWSTAEPHRRCRAGLSAAAAEMVSQRHDMLYVAIGILGATVMPHNLYLHSSIVQTRNFQRTPEPDAAQAIRFATIDSTTALTMALFINAAILILSAASAFHQRRDAQRGGRNLQRRLPSC